MGSMGKMMLGRLRKKAAFTFIISMTAVVLWAVSVVIVGTISNAGLTASDASDEKSETMMEYVEAISKE